MAFRIRNAGAMAVSAPFKVKLVVNHGPIKSWVVAPLAGGQESDVLYANVQYGLSYTVDPGWLAIVIDVDNDVSESNEMNNVVYDRWEPPMPDLQVSIKRKVVSLFTKKLVAVVKNIGNGTAGPFDVRHNFDKYWGVELEKTTRVQDLAPGATREIDITGTIGRWTKVTAYAIADEPENEVVESNEYNNRAEFEGR